MSKAIFPVSAEAGTQWEDVEEAAGHGPSSRVLEDTCFQAYNTEREN